MKESTMTSRFALAAAALAVASCKTSNDVSIGSASAAAPAASASAAAPGWLGVPRPSAEVLAVINKSGREPYSGLTGTLKGRVTMKGDPAPPSSETFPAEGCPQAAPTYGKAFRVGQDSALADAIVMVAEYDAFVPPDKPAVQVKAAGCAFDARTVAMTFGQRLEVLNEDAKGTYTPYLDGAEYRAVMLAMPGGDPVPLYPNKPAINYVLRDFQGRGFMAADVLVLKFSTLDVTGLDGRYEIGRIPIGKVSVDVYLPALDKHVIKQVEIAGGDNTLDLEMSFDAATDKVVARRPDPWTRGTDPNREAAPEGKFGASPKRAPKDAPR